MQEDCNKDIGWYKSVKDTQGSVEVTSFGQMRNILMYGHFIIGTTLQSNVVYDIYHLISLKLVPRDKPLTKTSYNLEELRDLESKLVLITGSKAENRTEVDHYLNVSEFYAVCVLSDICKFVLYKQGGSLRSPPAFTCVCLHVILDKAYYG